MDELKDIFISDRRNRLIAQFWLSDPQLALEYVLSELEQRLETMPQHAKLPQLELPAARSDLPTLMNSILEQTPAQL